MPAAEQPAVIVRALQRSSFFAGLPVEELEQVSASAEMLRYEDGQDVVTKGDVCDGVYLVEHGAAAAEIDGEVVMQYSPTSDFDNEVTLFGELAIFSGGED
eukprot:SAG22_NODE_450_length_10398_cov_8.760171_10_plen_101_part_00